MDINTDLLNGDFTPAQVFSDITGEVRKALEASSPNDDTIKNFNAIIEGLNIKDIHGTMKTPRPAELGVINMATGKYVAKTTKFILTGVARSKREKFQVTHGFDEEWLMTVFGKDVSLYRLSGYLVNLGGEKDWPRYLDFVYDHYLRAAVCVDNGWQVYLKYSNRVLRGYVVGKSEEDISEHDSYLQFSLDYLIRKDSMIDLVVEKKAEEGGASVG